MKLALILFKTVDNPYLYRLVFADFIPYLAFAYNQIQNMYSHKYLNLFFISLRFGFIDRMLVALPTFVERVITWSLGVEPRDERSFPQKKKKKEMNEAK